MLALNGADPLNGPRQWGSLLFCLVIVLSLQRAEGSTEETGSSYTKVRILPDDDSTRTTAIALPVASTTTSSLACNRLPKPSSAARVMSTRPSGLNLPSSQATTSAKVRWMSMPITRLTSPSCCRQKGSVGRHDTYGSALSAQPGESQRRPATNPSSRLIEFIGLPALRAPGASVPDGRTIRQNRSIPAGQIGTAHLHTGYECH